MTAHHELDRELTAFLREGADELPYESFDAVRDRTEQTRQRVFIGPWRTPTMNRFITYGLGTAAVAVLLLVGVQLFGPGKGQLGNQSTPTPKPTATAVPTSTLQAGLPLGSYVLDWHGKSARSAGITLTIPASGWTEFEPGSGILGKGVEVDNLPEAAILSYAEAPGTRFFVPGDPCHYMTTRPKRGATTVEQIAAAFVAQASRNASEPVDVTVGGHPGKMITLHTPDDMDASGCEGQEFVSFGSEYDDLGRYQQGPSQIDDVWIIDVDGSIVIFDAMYRPDTSAALQGEMQSIAGTATFQAP